MNEQFVALSSVCYHDNDDKLFIPKPLVMSVNYLEVQNCKCGRNTSKAFPCKYQYLNTPMHMYIKYMYIICSFIICN